MINHALHKNCYRFTLPADPRIFLIEEQLHLPFIETVEKNHFLYIYASRLFLTLMVQVLIIINFTNFEMVFLIQITVFFPLL
jgi:uncharacterized integral membrane protein